LFVSSKPHCQAEFNIQSNLRKPLLSGHSQVRNNWLLNRGGLLIEVHPKTMWGVVQFSLYQVQTNRSGEQVEQ